MTQAIGVTRPGGLIGYVGVPHGVEFDGADLPQTAIARWTNAARSKRCYP